MTFLKRAKLNITRNIGKTLVLFLLIFLLGSLLSIAIVVRNSIHQTESNLRVQLPHIASLEWEFRAEGYFDGETASFEFPTLDMIEAVASLSYVRDYDISGRHALYGNTETLQWVVLSGLNPNYFPSDVIEIGNDVLSQNLGWDGTEGVYMNMFLTKGINNPYPVDLQQELISLVDGRFINQYEIDNGALVVVVSSLFAEVNDLEVGSMISLENNLYDSTAMAESEVSSPNYWHLDTFRLAHQEIELEVIGTFDINQAMIHMDHETAWWLTIDLNNFYNQMYIPLRLQLEIATYYYSHMPESMRAFNLSDDVLVFEPIFLLNDPRDFSAFSQAASEVLPEYWYVVDNSGSFAPILRAMDNMLDISNLVFIGASIATIFSLTLMITLFLIDRRSEIGIYRALGESKQKIICQILIETFSVSIIAIFLAFFTGHLLSDNFSRNMLEQNLLQQEQENPFVGLAEDFNWDQLFFNQSPMTLEEMMAAYDVSLDGSIIAFFVTVQIVTISISTILPIAYILRLEPKEILL